MLIQRLRKRLAKNALHTSKRFFASDVLDIPTIDINKYLNKQQGWEKECKTVSDCLYETGILVVKDPRVNYEDNTTFISMMEKYFNQVSKIHYSGAKLEDAFPQYSFQVGATPEFKEKAKSHCDRFSKYPDPDKPISECPPVYDSKWRFFWLVGERNKEADEGMLIYPNVIPKAFPQWEKVMNTWGYKMLGACEEISRMAAIGFNLPENTLYDAMKYGGHLLAPTGSDLKKFNTGTVFAGIHYDLNFLTIHGKSNYGGLYIWLRNGQKKKVKVPDGCLLLQAGAQFEYLTGGHVLNGFHEVIYTQEVRDNVEKIIQDNKGKKEDDQKILWRVSSTLFSQIRQNMILQPLGHFATPEAKKKYLPILTRDQVAQELKDISLMTM